MWLKLKNFFLSNNSTRQTIAKNIFWMTFSQACGRFIRAMVIIYAARVLGAAQYGIFSYALGLAAFFTIFADVGVSVIMTREIAKSPERWRDYFATSFWLKLGLLLLTGALIVFVAPYFSKIEGAAALLPLIALLTFFDGVRDLATAFFRAKERMELEAFANVITNILITAVGFLILRSAPNYSTFTFFYVMSSGAGTLLTLMFLGRQFFEAIKNFSKKLAKEILVAAWPIAISALFGAFMLTIDIILLGMWRTAAEVGFYSSAQKIVQIFYAMPAILAGSTFPTISRMLRSGGDSGKVKILMEKSMTVALAVSIPMAVGGVVLANSIIHFLYGSGYSPAVSVFQIFVLTMPLAFVGPIFSNMILAYDKQKMLVKYLMVSAILNVIFDAILIPTLGINGSALGTLLIHTMYNGIIWVMAKRFQDFRVLPNLKKIILASGVLGIAAFIFDKMGLNVLITIGLAGICYFGFLYLVKERVLYEIKETLAILKK